MLIFFKKTCLLLLGIQQKRYMYVGNNELY